MAAERPIAILAALLSACNISGEQWQCEILIFLQQKGRR
jgi:hypothetical protein